jgi:hypothetical protein
MSRRKLPHAIWIAAVLVCLTPSLAEAHLMATGMGPVYDGVTHFGLSPEDYLPVIALGFYAGLRGPGHARLTLAGLVAGWIAGGVAGLMGFWPPAVALPAATAALFLIIGGALAANRDAPPVICALAALALGLIRGAADLMGVAWSLPHLVSVLGMTAGASVALVLAASVTLPLQRLWMIVAARVSGSWLAASGLLLAGWILRYGAAVQ